MSDDILELDQPYNTRVNNDALKKMAQKEEPRFLSILLKNRECLMEAVAFGIKPGNEGHFWMPKPRFLYSIIYEYYAKHNEVLTRTAMDSVMDSLGSIGGKSIDDDDRVTTRMYWDEVHNMSAPIEDFELLRDHINNRFVQWQAYDIMKEKIDTLVRATGNQDEIIKDIREQFLTINNLDADAYSLTMNMTDGIPEVMKVVEQQREHPELTDVIKTWIVAIDDVYHITPGSYTIISGMINGGKTTLMFNIAFNMARHGRGVIYVSMEKEAVPFFMRLLCLHALVDYNRIKNGGKDEKGLGDVYYKKLKDAAEDLITNIKPNLHCIQVAPGTKLSKILADVERIRSQHKIDALFVDYLGVIGVETHHVGRADLDEAMVSKRLQAYGKIHRVATFSATQLKTPSAKEIRNKSKKATADDPSKVEVNTEDLAGSKMIIADADNGMSALLNSDSPSTKMYVYGTKARDDEARRTIVLDFDGKIGLVADPSFFPDQIKEVDELIYNDKVSEEELESEDGLFSGGAENKEEPVDFDAVLNETKPEAPKNTETTEIKPDIDKPKVEEIKPSDAAEILQPPKKVKAQKKVEKKEEVDPNDPLEM